MMRENARREVRTHGHSDAILYKIYAMSQPKVWISVMLYKPHNTIDFRPVFELLHV